MTSQAKKFNRRKKEIFTSKLKFSVETCIHGKKIDCIAKSLKFYSIPGQVFFFFPKRNEKILTSQRKRKKKIKMENLKEKKEKLKICIFNIKS